MRIHEQLRSLRKSRGLCLEELSALSGVSISAINMVELGKTSPTLVILEKILAALSCELSVVQKSDLVPA